MLIVLLAMKPDLFIARRDHAERMDRLVARVRANPADRFSEVVMPGEPGSRLAAVRSRTGIAYGRKEFAMLRHEAATAGLPPLANKGQHA